MANFVRDRTNIDWFMNRSGRTIISYQEMSLIILKEKNTVWPGIWGCRMLFDRVLKMVRFDWLSKMSVYVWLGILSGSLSAVWLGNVKCDLTGYRQCLLLFDRVYELQPAVWLGIWIGNCCLTGYHNIMLLFDRVFGLLTAVWLGIWAVCCCLTGYMDCWVLFDWVSKWIDTLSNSTKTQWYPGKQHRFGGGYPVKQKFGPRNTQANQISLLVDGEPNGNRQPNESKCANVAGSGNRHTMCSQRAYLFHDRYWLLSPPRTDWALQSHDRWKEGSATCSQTLSLAHPTLPCAATHAPCMLPLQRCHHVTAARFRFQIFRFQICTCTACTRTRR